MERSESYLLNDSTVLEKEKARLRVQAEGLFKLEAPILRKHIEPEKTIIDIGCGNCEYLSVLTSGLGIKNAYGVDRNLALLEQAQEKFSAFKLLHMDFENLDLKHLRDLRPRLISRFVFQHLNKFQCHKLIKDLRKQLPDAKLIIVDTINSSMSISPYCESINFLNDKCAEFQASKGGNRNIGLSLSEILRDEGCSEVSDEKFFVSNRNMDTLIFEDIFKPVILCGIKSGIDEPKRHEDVLENWFRTARENSDYEIKYEMRIVTATL